LRGQVKAFLESALAEDDPNFLTACLKELRQARDKNHLTASDGFRPESLAEEITPFARFDDPEALLEAECAVVGEVAREFQRLGYRHLGRLLAVTPTRGQPLLAMAVQYYFRRSVGEDAILARELSWAKMVGIDRRVQEGFAFLGLIQERNVQVLEEVLEGLARREVAAAETRNAVLNLHSDVRGLADQFKLLRRELTSGHSVSYRDEHERELIEAVKRRYRALSDDQRRRFPQLGLDLSRLEIVAGDFEEALGEARAAARQLDEPTSKAEAHHAAYRAALELKFWDEALAELQHAVVADARFAVWPSIRYQVQRILGAGAFGVAFLCHDTYVKRQVVIKTFEPAGIDRDPTTIFREAHILDGLQHPGIIRLLGCGYVDENGKQRPYLEIEHFSNSLTLEDHVHRHGPLTVDDLLPVATPMAEALRAAQEANVLHRDVKPGNLLIRKMMRGWEVKVINFGLSLRRSLVQASQARAASQGRSMVGSAVAGTLHYAAPEQLDPLRWKEVGPHSDVFGFGRTCLFALFKTTQPRARAIRALPEPWPDLLDDCCDLEIGSRPKDFAAVLERLMSVQKPSPTALVSPPTTTETSALVVTSPSPQVSPPVAKKTARPVPSPRFTNSLSMTMQRIEPGKFFMGSTKEQIDKLMKQFPDLKREWFDDEQPQHPVKIPRPFYLAGHPVTVAQFRQFVEGSGYLTEAEKAGDTNNWKNPGFFQGDNHPVVRVSHNDALAFLGWLNVQAEENNRGYRLPTEAEWEYACRARTDGLYGYSDDSENLVRFANVADVSHKKQFPNSTCIRGDDGFVYTAPVGFFEHNAWHLYDMIGNVWEWCDDWYDPKFYQSSPTYKPQNTDAASARVIRGGSWFGNSGNCRPASRHGSTPGHRRDDVGFRLAASRNSVRQV
jgi:formylglycine-generating enzyme required for sulfatase activity